MAKKRNNKQKAKILEKRNTVKVKNIPQTYIESSFDDSIEHTEIINEVITKNNLECTLEELFEMLSFNNKIKKIRATVEYHKSFNFLLDFVHASKLYKMYQIKDSVDDEFDIILAEISNYFMNSIKNLKIDHHTYLKLINYFNDLKSLYGLFKENKFNNGDLVIRLNDMKKMEDFLRYYLF